MGGIECRHCSAPVCALEKMLTPAGILQECERYKFLGGTERSTEALGLWTSSLKMLNLRGLESANVAKAKIAKITALKISNPSRVFAVVAKAGFMGATDRSTKSQRLWTSSLRMWKFKRLETWNFQKFATRIFSCGPC